MKGFCDVLGISADDNDRFRYCFDGNLAGLQGQRIGKERGKEWADYVLGHGQA